jgi:hypothetical protein
MDAKMSTLANAASAQPDVVARKSDEICLRDLLQVEDSTELAAFVCPDTGVPLWSLIRSVFIHLIMSDRLYASQIVAVDGNNGILRGTPRAKMARLIAKAFLHNAAFALRARGDSPVVLMASGARLVKDGELNFNCLADYFLAVAPRDSLLIEEMFNWKWPFPRKHEKVMLHTPLRVAGAVRGKLNAEKYRAASNAMIDLLCARAEQLLDYVVSSQQREWLIKTCASAAGSLESRIDAYTSILKKSGAKILIKEEACYGGADNVSAMVAAKRLGVVTAEYQHGSVSSGHTAYNFSQVMLASDTFRNVLPEYFLSFGSWWSGEINAPVRHVVIGNPHRSTVTRKITETGVKRSEERRILILGDGIDTVAYLDLACGLATRLGDAYEVVFRPHPLERSAVNAKFSSQRVGSVRIDQNQDMYSSFQQCSSVISEVSTGLFEAVGLVEKVFIWDTPKSRFSFPSHPFFSFNSVEQLAEAITCGKGGVSAEQNARIWGDGWEENYQRFLRSIDADLCSRNQSGD